jgi:hypothetical protein
MALQRRQQQQQATTQAYNMSPFNFNQMHVASMVKENESNVSERPHAPMQLKAAATDNGIQLAVKCFNRFCDQQGYPHLEQLRKEDFEGSFAPKVPALPQMLQEFCTFLITETSQHTNKNLRPDTAAQYLSGVKNYIVKNVKSYTLFDDSDWYTELYHALKMRALMPCTVRHSAPFEMPCLRRS